MVDDVSANAGAGSRDFIGTVWQGAVARIDIRRHERRNALNTQLCRSIHSQAQAAADTARCIVITGQGTSFCAGADLDGVYGGEFIDALYNMLYGLQSLRIPVIAAVNGPAIGAGTQLAMACDLRVCDVGARFAVPTARNGMAVDAWTIRRLRDLAGAGTAARLMLMAEAIGVDEAISCGLAQRRGTVDDAVQVAQEVAVYAPLSLAYAKMVLNETGDDAAIQAEFNRVWASDDVREAAQARAEARRPDFTGR